MKELLIGITIVFLIYGVICILAYKECLEAAARDMERYDG